MSRPRFFAPLAQLDGAPVGLPADEAHHLRHVLRLAVGAEVDVFDGRGHEWRARVVAADKRDVQVALEEPRTAIPEPPVSVTLGIGLLKGDQMDAVVRDATMLGASAIAPFVSDHVAVPSRSRDGAIERWQRVAIASAKQCARAVVPDIRAVCSLDALLDDSAGHAVVAAVEPRADVSASALWRFGAEGPVPPRALVMVGPEGGWAASEIDRLVARGARLIQLGPRTLRAETAPTVVLSVLWTVWGW
jgi:16S rRNA (uracil1498-N3)-methyltransferase